MAIENMQGKISTTGMVNAAPPKIEAPDMSNIKMPAGMANNKPKQVAQKPAPQEAPKQEGLLEKVQNLTNEDKAVLSTVLSPSVSTVLSKVAPEYQKGYHKLFLPLVNYAKQKGITNKIIKNILEHIAVHSTIDMRQTLRGKRHTLGRLYRKVILPLCYWAGKK